MATPTFHRRLLDSLPGDEDSSPRSREVLGACWSRAQPTPVRAPKMLHWSGGLANELGLSPELMQSQEAADVLSGNALWPGMAPYAANYGGYQFGHWAGQLGDGRAIVLVDRCSPTMRSSRRAIRGSRSSRSSFSSLSSPTATETAT